MEGKSSEYKKALADGVMFVQITLNEGRPVEKKKALYANIVEVYKANWSYGNGEARYVS